MRATSLGKIRFKLIDGHRGIDFHLLSEVAKDILQISTVSLLETDIVEVMVLSPLPETGRSRLEIFTLPKILPQGKEKISNQFCPGPR